MNSLDLLSLRVLLDRVVVPARRHVRETLWPVALPVMACAAFLILAQIRWWRSFLNPDDFGAFFAGALVVLAMSFLTTFVYLMAFGALVAGAMEATAGAERISMGRAWAFVSRPRVFLTLLLIGLGCGLSFLFFVLPALFMVPLMVLVLPVMAAEGLTGSAALERAWELFNFNPGGSWRHSPWLQVLALLVVGSILSYAFSLAVQLPFVVAQQVIMTREAIEPEAVVNQMVTVLWLQLPSVVLGSIATALAWLYPAFGLCLLYRELRRKKEAPDLEQAIDEIVRPGGEG